MPKRPSRPLFKAPFSAAVTYGARSPIVANVSQTGTRIDSLPVVKTAKNLKGFLTRLALTEFFVLAGAAYVSCVVYHRVAFVQWPPASQYLLSATTIAFLNLLISIAFRDFQNVQKQPRHVFLWSAVKEITLAFSFFLSLMFLLKVTDEYSRGTFIVQFFCVCFASVAHRLAAYSNLQKAIKSGTIDAQRIAWIGDKYPIKQAEARIDRSGVRTVGTFPFPLTPDSVSNLVEACRVLQLDDVVIVPNNFSSEKTRELIAAISKLPVAIHLLPIEDSAEHLSSATIVDIGGVKTIQISHCPLSLVELASKRAFDIFGATIALIVFSPLFLITAIAIKIESRGPVFFRQTRHGYAGEIITVLKFRSMRMTDCVQSFSQASKDDPRVTTIGRLIRRSNIDELPQLINVIRSEMSLVGPRPHPVALNTAFQDLISHFARRHHVKPGITGWAQVNGYRGETDTLEKMERRVEYDRYYIDNWSLLFDIKIIIMTIFSKRAYLNAY